MTVSLSEALLTFRSNDKRTSAGTVKKVGREPKFKGVVIWKRANLKVLGETHANGSPTRKRSGGPGKGNEKAHRGRRYFSTIQEQFSGVKEDGRGLD